MTAFCGSCCTGVAFCCINCCFGEIKTCCGDLLGRSKVAKILCILLDVLVIVPAIFIFFFLQHWTDFVNKFNSWIQCPKQSGGGYNCFGISAVYRISMALLMLYFVILIMMLCQNRLSKVVNQGLFFIKFILVVGAFVGLLFINNSVFMGYGQVCKIIGVLFLILQSIILIDLFYLWGISWIKKYSEGNQFFGFLLILFSLLMYGGAITLNVYSYINFKHCTTWSSIITSVLLVLVPATQFLNFNIQNSLLTTSAICCYLSYLNFMAIYSNPTCQALSRNIMITDISVSSVLFFITMFGSVMGGSGVIKTSPETNLNQTLGIAPTDKQNQQEQNLQEDQPINQRFINQQNVEQQPQQLADGENDYVGWKWVKWYTYMCISSMYVGVLITNWGSPQEVQSTMGSYKPNSFAYWSRLGVEWGTCFVYIWTLIAPRLFPSRNFVIE